MWCYACSWDARGDLTLNSMTWIHSSVTLLTSRDLTWSSGRLTRQHASHISVVAHISWGVTNVSGHFESTQCHHLQGHWDSTRTLNMKHYVPSKRPLPITDWRGFISHNKRVVSTSSTSAPLFFTKFRQSARNRAQTPLHALTNKSNFRKRKGSLTKFLDNISPT